MKRQVQCVVLSLTLLIGCAQNDTARIVLLTRQRCVSTAALQQNLDSALLTLGSGISYSVIDQGTLLASDVRSGYPSPTILVDGVDLFGLPTPQPPHAPS